MGATEAAGPFETPRSFALTSGAARAMKALVADRDPTSGAGLRISRIDTPCVSLLLSVVPGPEDDDHVIWSNGATLFVGPEAREQLQGKVLDVEVNPQGVALFSLADDTAEAPSP